YTAIGWTQSGDTAAHAGPDNAAAGFASHRECNQPGRSCGTRPGARSRRSFFQEPWIHGLSAKPDIVQRQGSETELCHEHRTGLVQSADNRCIVCRDAIAVRFSAVGCGNTCCVEKVLCSPGNSMQGPAISSRRNFGV